MIANVQSTVLLIAFPTASFAFAAAVSKLSREARSSAVGTVEAPKLDIDVAVAMTVCVSATSAAALSELTSTSVN